MSYNRGSYDAWLERPYQDHYASHDEAEYIEERTCPVCGVEGPAVIEDRCDRCWAAKVATEIAIARGES